jgi:hypothetical protein
MPTCPSAGVRITAITKAARILILMLMHPVTLNELIFVYGLCINFYPGKQEQNRQSRKGIGQIMEEFTVGLAGHAAPTNLEHATIHATMATR